MVEVNGTTIKMVAGDTAKIMVSLTDATGAAYTPEAGDAIRFAVKDSYYSDTVLLENTIPTETMTLVIHPGDTKSFAELSPSKDYVYDIQITFENGDVDTFIRGKFILLGEVD